MKTYRSGNTRAFRFGVASLALLGVAMAGHAAEAPYIHAPSVETYARHDPNGLTILPNGRYLKPVGRHLPVATFPYGLAMSRDGSKLFVASDGVGQLITNWRGAKPEVAVVTPPVFQRKPGRREKPTNAGGADFSPDGRTLYWSSGETGAIYLFDVASREKTAEVSLNTEVGGRKYEDSYAVDVKVSADGKHLYAADVTNFRVVVVDAEKRQVIGSVRVGRYPYALAVVGNKVYAANIGLFEYSPIGAPNDARFDKRGLTFPPYGYPSDRGAGRGGIRGAEDSRPGRAECARVVFRLGRGRLEPARRRRSSAG